jgi:hypothetical protein
VRYELLVTITPCQEPRRSHCKRGQMWEPQRQRADARASAERLGVPPTKERLCGNMSEFQPPVDPLLPNRVPKPLSGIANGNRENGGQQRSGVTGQVE